MADPSGMRMDEIRALDWLYKADKNLYIYSGNPDTDSAFAVLRQMQAIFEVALPYGYA